MAEERPDFTIQYCIDVFTNFIALLLMGFLHFKIACSSLLGKWIDFTRSLQWLETCLFGKRTWNQTAKSMVCCLGKFVAAGQLYIYNTAEGNKVVCSKTVTREMAEEWESVGHNHSIRDVFTHFIASKSRKLPVVFLHLKIACY